MIAANRSAWPFHIGRPADFLDDDKGRFERLVEDIEHRLTGTFDKRGIFLGAERSSFGPGPLAGDLW
jgi:hypothetical protein